MIRYFEITENDLTKKEYGLSSSDITYLKKCISGYENAEVEHIILYDMKDRTVAIHNYLVFFGKESLH
jgi:hypothetical protein